MNSSNNPISTSTSAAPRKLRLHGLRSVDEAVVEIFLKLLRQQTRNEWVLSGDKEVDLLLVSPQNLDARDVMTQSAQLVWVAPANVKVAADGHARLSQPLQLDAFQEVLLAVDAKLSTVVGMQASSRSQTVMATASVPAASPAQVSDVQQVRYKLKRWPAAQHLAAHRYYSRLASFLSSRYLNQSELVMLSNVEWAVCAEFLKLMREQSLLDVRAPEAAAASGLAARTAAKAGPSKAEERNMPGLIGRLRERLGLARQAGVVQAGAR
jgi:hypothetical protein